jgi:hypothetical protein
MAPAIEAVVTALTRINAAQIGKDLGSAFVGAGEAMKGFQSAVDAFQAGNISLALKSIFESVKLQAMETGNSIYTKLTAAFQTVVDFVKQIFDPSGMLVTYISGTFELIGLKAASALASSLASALPDDMIFGGLKKGMSDFATTAKEDSDTLFGAMYHDVDALKKQLASAGAAMPENFAKHQAALSAGFINTAEQAKKVKDVQEEINTATGKHPALIKDAAQEMRD